MLGLRGNEEELYRAGPWGTHRLVVSLLLKVCVCVFLFLIQARNIRLVSEAVGQDEDSDSEGLGEIFLDGLSSDNPYGARLNVDEQGRLSWPVLFLYPEHAQSDFISAFHEDSRYLFAQEPPVLAGMLFPCYLGRRNKWMFN